MIKAFFSLLSTVIFLSCQNIERELNINFSGVTKLNLPDDNVNINLRPITTASEVFKWDEAIAEDGGLVLYELAFDKEGGDFSKPVFKILSDGGGTQRQATVTHKQLVKIAAAGGINSSSTGKLKWTVIASKSLNLKVSTTIRTIQIQRPAGFAEIPSALYITGTATEAGADIAKAVPMKKVEDGVFEIYTSLKEGTYQLTDKQNTTGRKFYIDGSSVKEGTNNTTVSGASKVYRIRYDFNVAAVLEATEIKEVGLYMSAYNAEIGKLSYVGAGKWQSSSIPVVFYPFSWGRDERYKFVLHTSAGDQYVGSSNANNGSSVGQPASYFYIYPVSDNQWDNTYKFNPSADNGNIKASLIFGTQGPYYHEITTL